MSLIDAVSIDAEFRYFDKKTVGLDFEGMKEDMKVRLKINKRDTS